MLVNTNMVTIIDEEYMCIYFYCSHLQNAAWFHVLLFQDMDELILCFAWALEKTSEKTFKDF